MYILDQHLFRGLGTNCTTCLESLCLLIGHYLGTGGVLSRVGWLLQVLGAFSLQVLGVCGEVLEVVATLKTLDLLTVESRLETLDYTVLLLQFEFQVFILLLQTAASVFHLIILLGQISDLTCQSLVVVLKTPEQLVYVVEVWALSCEGLLR